MTVEAISLLKRRPWGIVGALVLLAVIAVAILAPFITPYEPNEIDLRYQLQPPGGDHILGTDNLGHDVFTMLLYGSRPYVIAGLTATGMAIFLGLLLGLVSAIIGGRTDKILRWVVLVFPMLVGLALLLPPVYYLVYLYSIRPIIILELIRPSGFTAVYIPLFISLVFIPSVYSVVRNAYISASSRYRTTGSPENTSNFASFGRGLVPLIPLTLVTFGLAIGMAVFIISWAGYYGLGVLPGTPEWGRTLSSIGLIYMQLAPWITRYTAIAIVATLVGTILFGQALHEIWFPRIASPLPAGSDQESSLPPQTGPKAS